MLVMLATSLLNFFQMRNYYLFGIKFDRSSSYLFAARRLILLRKKNLRLKFKLCYAFKLVYDSINQFLTTNEQCVVMVTLPNAKTANAMLKTCVL